MVEDDPEFRTELGAFLEEHGFLPIGVADSAGAIAALEADAKPAIVLIDKRLRGEDGFDVLREIRRITAVPCIFLTAWAENFERVLGLELGADDYIPKTADPREIVARIRAVLRRTRVEAETGSSSERVGRRWRLAREDRDVIRPDGTPVGLTAAEYQVFALLHDADGATLSREELMRRVFGRNYNPEDRAVDNVVFRLRRKLAANGGGNQIIKTVRPTGYVFTRFPCSEDPDA